MPQISKWRQEERERALLQPVLTRCSFCEWKYQGPLMEGRQEAAQHRREAHPEVRPKRRRPMRNPRAYVHPELTDEDRQEIETERRRRARETGVDLDA